MYKKTIQSENAPKAIGPYSPAILLSESKELIFLSGQIALPAQGKELVSSNVEEQTVQIMSNIESLLKEVDASFNNIVKTTIYIKDMNDFAKINEIYGKYFPDVPPARATVEVSRLPKDALVEIDAIVAK